MRGRYVQCTSVGQPSVGGSEPKLRRARPRRARLWLAQLRRARLTALRPGRAHHEVAAGVVGRRRPLPSGRAIAGAFFVAVAVVVVFATWLGATGGSGRAWVVALRDLPAGVRLGSSDLGTRRMTLPADSTGRVAFRDPADLVGRVLAASLRTGELVQTGDLSPRSPSALRPVTVEVAPSDLADLTTGTMVDVLVTDGSDPSSPTSVVVARARVLDIGRPSSSLIAGSTGAELTLGVSTLTQVTGIVHAAHTGTLSVVVGAAGDSAAPGAGSSAGRSTGPTAAASSTTTGSSSGAGG